jgi:hypothetical protein
MAHGLRPSQSEGKPVAVPRKTPPTRRPILDPMEPIDFAMQAIFQPISTFAAALSGYD